MNAVPDRRRGRNLLLAVATFVTTFAVIWAMGRSIPPRDLDRFDQSFYLAIAYDLHRHGVYSDGVFGPIDGIQGTPAPGMFIGPVYPALLSLVMRADPAFAGAAECMLMHRKSGEVRQNCKPYTSIVFPLHHALWAGSVALIWLVAGAAFGPVAAWAAAALALTGAVINLNLTHWVMTESLSVFLATLHGVLLFFAVRDRSAALAALAGAALGPLALTRPSYLYLLWAYLAVAALAGLAFRGFLTRRTAVCIGAFAAGCAALVLPWCLRNWMQVGTFGLTQGYGAHVLFERLAFNNMTFSEWAASFIYWIPRFGDDLAKWLFGEELIRRLNWNLPESFYLQGIARRMQLSAAEIEGMMPRLLSEELLGNLGQHLFVTVSLFWNGLMVYGHLGLILLPFLVALIINRARHRDAPMLLFLLPPLFMNALHAAVATNQPRYNLALLGALAVAGGWTVSAIVRRVRRHHRHAGSAARQAPAGG